MEEESREGMEGVAVSTEVARTAEVAALAEVMVVAVEPVEEGEAVMVEEEIFHERNDPNPAKMAKRGIRKVDTNPVIPTIPKHSNVPKKMMTLLMPMMKIPMHSRNYTPNNALRMNVPMIMIVKRRQRQGKRAQVVLGRVREVVLIKLV